MLRRIHHQRRSYNRSAAATHLPPGQNHLGWASLQGPGSCVVDDASASGVGPISVAVANPILTTIAKGPSSTALVWFAARISTSFALRGWCSSQPRTHPTPDPSRPHAAGPPAHPPSPPPSSPSSLCSDAIRSVESSALASTVADEGFWRGLGPHFGGRVLSGAVQALQERLPAVATPPSLTASLDGAKATGERRVSWTGGGGGWGRNVWEGLLVGWGWAAPP